MNMNPFEEAIRSDLLTLSSIKMGYVSAQDLYGRVFKFALKLSLIMLLINTGIRLAFMSVGLFNIPLTPGLVISLLMGTWVFAFVISLLPSMVFSRILIISRLLKGRLKIEGLIRDTFKNLARLCFWIYVGTYSLLTLLIVAIFGDVISDPFVLIAVTVLPQGFAFLVSTAITGFISGVEFERLGLGAVFNIVSEIIKNAKNQNQPNPLRKGE